NNRLRRFGGNGWGARFFFGTRPCFCFGLQARSFFLGTALFEFALLFGVNLFLAALDEGLLLAYFDADRLAAGNPQGAGGLALQGNLARLLGFRAVAALQMGQQGLFFTV